MCNLGHTQGAATDKLRCMYTMYTIAVGASAGNDGPSGDDGTIQDEVQVQTEYSC